MLIRQWNNINPIERVGWETEGRGQFYYKFHVIDELFTVLVEYQLTRSYEIPEKTFSIKNYVCIVNNMRNGL